MFSGRKKIVFLWISEKRQVYDFDLILEISTAIYLFLQMLFSDHPLLK